MRYYYFDSEYMQAYRPVGRFVRVITEAVRATPQISGDWLDFTDRNSYISWVERWKAEYRCLAEAQRALRLELRNPHEDIDYTSRLQSCRTRYRAMLRALLLIRTLGREHARQLKAGTVITA